MNRSNSDLRSRAESIVRLMEQREELDADIKAAFDAAQSVGFNKPALKKAITIARMDSKQREKYDTAQSDLLLYLDELERQKALEAAE